MIFHPAIIALLVGSILTTGMLLYSSYYAGLILRYWDIRSGSELQLSLERRTYLISTMLAYALGFQALSLFLFIYTVDSLSSLFVGAMCAAGTLNVNEWGYPTILIKLLNFLLAGVWLILNYTDNRASDYPLIRRKYLLLILVMPLVIVECVMQGAYFLGLDPEVITSCCGTLFSSSEDGLKGEMVGLPRTPVEVAFYASMITSFVLGGLFWFKGKGGYLFAASSFLSFLLSITALISFISLYFYELPTHHCPFCILHEEYYHVGYGIYTAFLGGAVSGLGVGALMPFRSIESLRSTLPGIQRRLALVSILCYAAFMLIAGLGMFTSNLRMH
jgi:hypothetical protein